LIHENYSIGNYLCYDCFSKTLLLGYRTGE